MHKKTKLVILKFNIYLSYIVRSTAHSNLLWSGSWWSNTRNRSMFCIRFVASNYNKYANCTYPFNVHLNTLCCTLKVPPIQLTYYYIHAPFAMYNYICLNDEYCCNLILQRITFNYHSLHLPLVAFSCAYNNLNSSIRLTRS